MSVIDIFRRNLRLAVTASAIEVATTAKMDHRYQQRNGRLTVKDTQPSIVVEKAFPDLGKYVRYKGVKINTFSVDYGKTMK